MTPVRLDSEITALIRRRRLQLLVHSAIYYAYNESIVTDEQWKNWALELEELQAGFPNEASAVEYNGAFSQFNHSTGYDLPYNQPEIMAKARWLLRLHDQRKGGVS